MNGDFRYGMMLQLGNNMWQDELQRVEGATEYQLARVPKPYLDTDEDVWRETTDACAAAGINLLLMDLGEGIVYPSHPELSVRSSWEPDKLRAELKRLRAMGLEPIPKCNFSCGHDSWLKEYHRMVSTPEYYRVCSDIIRDVSELFDRPRLFHIGYDEETAKNQRGLAFMCIRQGELWWHDFLWFVKTVEGCGMRAWMWSDFMWHHHDEFLSRCPKSVMQSNWYYYKWFEKEKMPEGVWKYFQCSLDLDKAGFDQIPCGSNWFYRPPAEYPWTAKDYPRNVENIPGWAKFCRENLSQKHYHGFLCAPWCGTKPKDRPHLREAIGLMREEVRRG